MFTPSPRLRCALGMLVATLAACGHRPAVKSTQPAPRAYVYVTNEDSGVVNVIDTATDEVAGTITVGKRPRGIRVSRDGRTLYVALSGSPKAPPGVDESKLPPADRSADGIGVVDLASSQLERTLHAGQDPKALDLSPDGKLLFVSNEATAELSVVDVASGELLRRVRVGEAPEGVTTHPDGRFVYVTCEADNHVAVVDTTTWKVIETISTAARPRSIVFTPDGARAFVTGEHGGRVDVVNTRAHRLMGSVELVQQELEPMPPRPMGALLAPGGRRLYVSNGRAASVSVLEIGNPKEVQRFLGVGTRPWGLGLSPDGRKLYTANGPSGDVSVVDTSTGLVIKKLPVGGSPWGIDVGPTR